MALMNRIAPHRLWTYRFAASMLLLLVLTGAALTHPLGNFTVNHFSRLTLDSGQVAVRYVVDMAEISTFQELPAVDADRDGQPSQAELEAYARRAAAQYATGLKLAVDGLGVGLRVANAQATIKSGEGNLPTLRVECDLVGDLPVSGGTEQAAHRLTFEDQNQSERIGWREIVVAPANGMSVFDSTAYGNGLTNELKEYPADLLTAPLAERRAELSFARGTAPAGSRPLLTRDGRTAVAGRDRLTELIAVRELTLPLALLGLLVAFGLGGMHAMSPGHGKTVVGAYLVGSRGTARHAAFLGLTVTITHTVGVFALGFVTLFASQYVIPEKLFPLLSLISGGIVLVIGLSLFVKRLRAAAGSHAHSHAHPHGSHSHHAHDHSHHHSHDHSHDHSHHHSHDHAHSHAQADHSHHDHHAHSHDAASGEHHHGDGVWHSHGGRAHTHLPPGADGSQITWRSLLALGVSGGLLPCPSALVVLLAAISLHRVGYGLLLILAFSLGLASVLTAVGLAFVYAGRWMKLPQHSERLGGGLLGGIVKALPALSALVIAVAGAAICYEALQQAGVNLGAIWNPAAHPATSISAVSVLGFGLLIGLKHALEADHLAAVATIVSERKSWLSSSLVGGLWGVGHTISLLIAGVAVILLHVRIGGRVALALEMGVGVMLIGLGANALRKVMRGGKLHWHAHAHGGHTHLHPHLHKGQAAPEPHSHHGFRLDKRPLLVGMVHGMAGSAALMLLVLSTIPSPLLGLAYIAIFGLGSICGMMIVSSLVGLPMHLTASRFTRANLFVRVAAGIFSLGFGAVMVYQIGFVEGLLR